MTNIERHAHATTVTLDLLPADSTIKLVMQDDGQGFSLEGPLSNSNVGIGLTNMRERVELMDGEFSIESEPGKGTRICVTLPGNSSKDKIV